jgi:hypothetical protein
LLLYNRGAAGLQGGTMRQLGHPREALAGVALVAALFAGYVGASLVASAEAASSANPPATETAIETEPTTPPQPSPDPAPPEPPKPVTRPSPKAKTVTHAKPKPAPAGTNPAPVPAAQTPPHVSRPPAVANARLTQTPKRRYAPQKTHVATPTHASRPVNRNPLLQPRRHKQRKAAVPRAKPAPKAPSDVEAAAVVSRDTDRRAFVIAGLVVASLLLLIPLALPAMGARFTSVGRAVMDHQTDLLLAGIATLLVTAVVFFLTQGA